jgi:hypothetical protein
MWVAIVLALLASFRGTVLLVKEVVLLVLPYRSLRGAVRMRRR